MSFAWQRAFWAISLLYILGQRCVSLAEETRMLGQKRLPHWGRGSLSVGSNSRGLTPKRGGVPPNVRKRACQLQWATSSNHAAISFAAPAKHRLYSELRLKTPKKGGYPQKRREIPAFRAQFPAPESEGARQALLADTRVCVRGHGFCRDTSPF